MQHLDFRRKMIQRINAYAVAVLGAIRLPRDMPQGAVHAAIKMFQRKREDTLAGDVAQWRRWYRANKKRQRQLAALKQRDPNFKIHPNAASLPRWVVP